MIGNNLLNQIILEKNIDGAGEILSMLNKGVKSAFTQEGEQEAQDGMDMALCVISTTPAPSSTGKAGPSSAKAASSRGNGAGLLQYAGANNPLCIIRKDANSTEISKKAIPFGEGLEGAIIKADKTPIGGVTETNYSFTSHTVELQKGDTIYLFSDGYQDQFGGPQGKKFRTKQFKELLLSIQDKNMVEQKEILNKTLHDWKGDEEQVDDILVIGIRI